MHHTRVKLSELTTLEDHTAALAAIEGEYRNYGVSLSVWLRGCTDLHLSKGAEKKVAAIWARIDTKFPTED